MGNFHISFVIFRLGINLNFCWTPTGTLGATKHQRHCITLTGTCVHLMLGINAA